MVDFNLEVDNILKIVEEAKTRNYPDHVLRFDLNRYLQHVYKTTEEQFNEELELARQEAEDDVREEVYNDGYNEGQEDSQQEHRDTFIKELAEKIIKLKQYLKDNKLSDKEIQIKITELLLDMDEDGALNYSRTMTEIEEFDVEQ